MSKLTKIAPWSRKKSPKGAPVNIVQGRIDIPCVSNMFQVLQVDVLKQKQTTTDGCTVGASRSTRKFDTSSYEAWGRWNPGTLGADFHRILFVVRPWSSMWPWSSMSFISPLFKMSQFWGCCMISWRSLDHPGMILDRFRIDHFSTIFYQNFDP